MAFYVAKQRLISLNHSWLLYSEVFSVEGGFLLTQFEVMWFKVGKGDNFPQTP